MTILGVEPGDSLTLFRTRDALPGDCERRLADLIPDAAGVHWNDPAASDVDARVIEVNHLAAMPFEASSTSMMVDGETATRIPYRPDDRTTVSVTVISCPSADYAALRRLL